MKVATPGVRVRDRRRRPADPGTPARSAPTSARSCRSTACEFADWWRDRLVPEMQRNFDYLEAHARPRRDEISLAQLAVLLEDAIDIHDRHWKIHWMLNFAQLSATLNLRAVMEKTHGKVDQALLGRLQNSASDRNWDKIRALWEMKEEVTADPELQGRVRGRDGRRDRPRASRPPSAAAGSSPSGSSPTSRSSAGTRCGATSSSSRRFLEQMEPIIQLVRDQFDPTTTTRRKSPSWQPTSRRPPSEILEGLEGEALEEMRAANEINLRMAPLTPDHHFYIDQGANAHVRLVLLAIGEKLVAAGRPRPPRRRRPASATTSCGRSSATRPASTGGRIVAAARASARGRLHGPAARLGRHRDRDPARLPIPQPVGLPREVQSRPGAERRPR